MKTEVKVILLILSILAIASAISFSCDADAVGVDSDWSSPETIFINGEEATYRTNISSTISPTITSKDLNSMGVEVKDVKSGEYYQVLYIEIDLPITIDISKVDFDEDGRYIIDDAVRFMMIVYKDKVSTVLTNLSAPLIITQIEIPEIPIKEITFDWVSHNVTEVVTIPEVIDDFAFILGTDYELTGETDGVNAKTYTATITVLSPYFVLPNAEKSMDITWTINQKDIKDVEYIDETSYSPTSFVYDGKSHRPAIKKISDVGADGVIYKLTSSDYTNTTTKMTDVGTYPLSITAVSGGNFCNSIILENKWSINASSDWYFTLDPKSYTFNGEYQGPPTVKAYSSSGTVISANNYVVTSNPERDVGEYVVIVKMISGNYTGEKEDTWTIEPLPTVDISNYVLHVNTIHLNGPITKETFEGNIFLFAHGSVIPSNCYTITVKDGWGRDIIIDDENQELRTTTSEWNYIEVNGIESKGFVGQVIGEFYAYPDIGYEFPLNGIKYSVTGEKTVSVTGYESGINSALVIPDFVNGFKVTKIADKAFYGCKTITSLELGDYVTSIGVKAFTNCTKLQSVEFEDSLKTISAYAFYGCTRLADVSMDDSVKTIGSYAFYKCTALKTINISGALKTLGGNAFSVSFIDADGKGITQTAKNLAGHTFEGSNKVLKLVA